MIPTIRCLGRRLSSCNIKNCQDVRRHPNCRQVALGCDRLLVNPDLLEHSELIPVVPTLDDFSLNEPGDRNSATAHPSTACRQPKPISCVCHDGGPAQNHFVARTKHVLDLKPDIRERTTNFPHEFFKFLRSASFLSPAPLPRGYPIRRKHLIHCLDSAFVPHLLEPASHQLNVFLC